MGSIIASAEDTVIADLKLRYFCGARLCLATTRSSCRQADEKGSPANWALAR